MYCVVDNRKMEHKKVEELPEEQELSIVDENVTKHDLTSGKDAKIQEDAKIQDGIRFKT